jgi:shikimate dehydrogenase
VRKFGLIGYPLGHSFSANYFSRKFREAQITDCSYTNFELKDIRELETVLKDPELCGFNVTIPYKEAVIPYLDTLDPVVRQTGACNCVRIRDGALQGFNTDVAGFEYSLKEKWEPEDRKALILGTGGSSKAVAYVLQKMDIRYLYVSRTAAGPDQLRYTDLDERLIREHTLIINCTPLGMYPQTQAAPPVPYQYLGPAHYLFDLIYNPPETTFLREGKARGARTKNGEDMLKIQADASWDIWNDASGGS